VKRRNVRSRGTDLSHGESSSLWGVGHERVKNFRSTNQPAMSTAQRPASSHERVKTFPQYQ